MSTLLLNDRTHLIEESVDYKKSPKVRHIEENHVFKGRSNNKRKAEKKAGTKSSQAAVHGAAASLKTRPPGRKKPINENVKLQPRVISIDETKETVIKIENCPQVDGNAVTTAPTVTASGPACQENEIVDKRTGRYLAAAVTVAMIVVTLYHAFLKNVPLLNGLLPPTIIMLVYLLYALYMSKRRKRKMLGRSQGEPQLIPDSNSSTMTRL